MKLKIEPVTIVLIIILVLGSYTGGFFHGKEKGTVETQNIYQYQYQAQLQSQHQEQFQIMTPESNFQFTYKGDYTNIIFNLSNSTTNSITN